MIKLIEVPEEQKIWFKFNYNLIKTESDKLEHLDYEMFENNLFGKNDRFINYKGGHPLSGFGLITSYCCSFDDKPEKTGFIRDCLICVLEDCKEFEFFELAHNLRLILDSFNEYCHAN